MSLPTRERGLKHGQPQLTNRVRLSLPTRERGLKHRRGFASIDRAKVAPYTGAWIETLVVLDW